MNEYQTITGSRYVPHSAGVLCGVGVVTVKRTKPWLATLTVELSEDGRTWRAERFLSRQKFGSYVLHKPTRIRVFVSECSRPFQLRMGVPT